MIEQANAVVTANLKTKPDNRYIQVLQVLYIIGQVLTGGRWKIYSDGQRVRRALFGSGFIRKSGFCLSVRHVSGVGGSGGR